LTQKSLSSNKKIQQTRVYGAIMDVAPR